MLNNDMNDLLNSDEDELFTDICDNIFENDLATVISSSSKPIESDTSKTNKLDTSNHTHELWEERNFMNISENNSSVALTSSTPLLISKSDIINSPHISKNMDRTSFLNSLLNCDNESNDVFSFVKSNTCILKSSEICNSSPKGKKNSFAEVVDISSESAILHNDLDNLNHGASKENTSLCINNRFMPGYTPKVKKRKFPGPAGLLPETQDELSMDQSTLHKKKPSAYDADFSVTANSQFSVDNILLASWKNLQAAVSSCASLLSTAKHYSLFRVLKESSKKKLPKHMVVPILCVLVKEINFKKQNSICVFMDDTGEINGRIDDEVLTAYKEYITEGTALILKKITILCNILILKSSSIVSIYLPNGTVKKIQELDNLLENSESLKPMNCECSQTLNRNEVKNVLHLGKYKSSLCSTVSKITNNSLSCSNVQNKLQKFTYKKSNVNLNKCITESNVIPKANQEPLLNNSVKSYVNEDLCEGSFMDDFDELLGALDEKSFMG